MAGVQRVFRLFVSSTVAERNALQVHGIPKEKGPWGRVPCWSTGFSRSAVFERPAKAGTPTHAASRTPAHQGANVSSMIHVIATVEVRPGQREGVPGRVPPRHAASPGRGRLRGLWADHRHCHGLVGPGPPARQRRYHCREVAKPGCPPPRTWPLLTWRNIASAAQGHGCQRQAASIAACLSGPLRHSANFLLPLGLRCCSRASLRIPWRYCQSVAAERTWAMTHPDQGLRRINRRRLLQVGGIGMLGLGLPRLLHAGARPALPGRRRQGDPSCIFIVQYGGMSHIDSWDPKPTAPDEHSRPLSSRLPRRVPGIQVCELLPRLAGMADRYCRHPLDDARQRRPRRRHARLHDRPFPAAAGYAVLRLGHGQAPAQRRATCRPMSGCRTWPATCSRAT